MTEVDEQTTTSESEVEDQYNFSPLSLTSGDESERRSQSDTCNNQLSGNELLVNSDEEYLCESEGTVSSSSDCSEDEDASLISTNNVIYPGASMTVEDSILSIMKYAMRHKTTYSALTDLLGLVSLHLPNNSDKEHLRSLYFLKKAFSSSHERNDKAPINIIEYCPICEVPYGDAVNCTICQRAKAKRDKNYFLKLDIGEQLQDMFKGKCSYHDYRVINT